MSPWITLDLVVDLTDWQAPGDSSHSAWVKWAGVWMKVLGTSRPCAKGIHTKGRG